MGLGFCTVFKVCVTPMNRSLWYLLCNPCSSRRMDSLLILLCGFGSGWCIDLDAGSPLELLLLLLSDLPRALLSELLVLLYNLRLTFFGVTSASGTIRPLLACAPSGYETCLQSWCTYVSSTLIFLFSLPSPASNSV